MLHIFCNNIYFGSHIVTIKAKILNLKTSKNLLIFRELFCLYTNSSQDSYDISSGEKQLGYNF